MCAYGKLGMSNPLCKYALSFVTGTSTNFTLPFGNAVVSLFEEDANLRNERSTALHALHQAKHLLLEREKQILCLSEKKNLIFKKATSMNHSN
jgi:hypothetical protein